MSDELKTIGELIDHLAQYPRDTRLVTRGFDEAGYADFSLVKQVRIVPNKSFCWDYYDAARRNAKEAFDALLLN